jgi:hypothetical protein
MQAGSMDVRGTGGVKPLALRRRVITVAVMILNTLNGVGCHHRDKRIMTSQEVLNSTKPLLVRGVFVNPRLTIDREPSFWV